MLNASAAISPPEDRSANTKADACADVLALIHEATPGAWITYHTGLLAEDREREPTVAGTAAAYWDAAMSGAVFLAQKRIDQSKYEYRAQKAR